MPTDSISRIRLEAYRPSDYLVGTIALDVRLDPLASRIRAELTLRPNPAGDAGAPLVLDGDELTLVSLALDGAPLAADAYAASPQRLTLDAPPQRPFTLTVETRVDPSANTKLMGLYRSNGVYCTQCEADGFRRITYFLDRPDVLSVYTTRIEADRDEAPILLGNGNPVGSGGVPDTNRHFAVWHDPHPKPAYLFAIVGGRLGKVATRFTTMEGRDVDVAVYVEPGKEPRADYALDAVIRSMTWDEETFGRAYDLDVFNVVAVSDFNMGAMENKGLNIFNDKYVLASPETATDADYANIEAIIAHEYFHNWSGNRVTCRDWFQLCLKEGLTVLRDQEFSSDMRSRAVHRIGEVKTLRARQFTEDDGPLAHAVRPRTYVEINNFYTPTVYEKGAEIVRMLRTLIGPDAFRVGMDRYFADNDGTAATVEDFLAAFEKETGRDLSHFAQWYERPGTPRIAVHGVYDAAARTYRLTFEQSRPGAGGDAPPLVIPVALGLVAADGALDRAVSSRVENGVFVLDRAEDTLLFEHVEAPPVASVFRGFSAPVRIEQPLSDAERLTLLRHDLDPFNRWEASQRFAMRLLVARSRGRAGGEDSLAAFVEALGSFLDAEAERDPAFAALVLTSPSESDVAGEIADAVDPGAILSAHQSLKRDLGAAMRDRLLRLYEDLAPSPDATFAPDAASAGRRALRNAALGLISAANPEAGTGLAQAQLAAATNMTDRIAALSVLSLIPGQGREDALAAFAETYRDEPLVLDKWFAIQATIPEEGTLTRVRDLRRAETFSISNPNRVRALIGAFSTANPSQFHRLDGAGYALLAETAIEVDGRNPQVAARLLTAFGAWRKLEPRRRAAAEATLRRVASTEALSRDARDIVERSLAG